MAYIYRTKSVCAKDIKFDVDDEGSVRNVVFTAGCGGNLQGIGKLVEGMPVDEVIEKLKGINCGMKGTSCPDQLATALERWKAKID